ncbi:MAG: NUDIX hydrolase [Pseudomonadota bacterium]
MTSNSDLDSDFSEHWPKAAASAAIFRGQEILIVKRGKGRMQGLWSFPGGHIKPGETARAAATREVREETGVVADIKSLVDVHDAIFFNDNKELRAHYTISVYCGVWLSGEPVAASDASAAHFVLLTDLKSYQLTHGIENYARRAAKILHSLGDI